MEAKYMNIVSIPIVCFTQMLTLASEKLNSKVR